MGRARFTILGMIFAALGSPLRAQERPPDPAELLKAQRAAMVQLGWLQGRWQGEAWISTPRGRREFIQTERVGPMLDGALVVIEGKSFERDGRPAAFNAFGVMSYDPISSTYAFHSYAQGRSGDFPLTVTPTGYQWTLPAGPTTIRYTATREGETWHQVGEVVRPDQTVSRIFEMTLRRLGDTDWPLAGGATAPQP